MPWILISPTLCLLDENPGYQKLCMVSMRIWDPPSGGHSSLLSISPFCGNLNSCLKWLKLPKLSTMVVEYFENYLCWYPQLPCIYIKYLEILGIKHFYMVWKVYGIFFLWFIRLWFCICFSFCCLCCEEWNNHCTLRSRINVGVRISGGVGSEF